MILHPSYEDVCEDLTRHSVQEFFADQMPFQSPNQQCESWLDDMSEGILSSLTKSSVTSYTRCAVDWALFSCSFFPAERGCI